MACYDENHTGHLCIECIYLACAEARRPCKECMYARLKGLPGKCHWKPTKTRRKK